MASEIFRTGDVPASRLVAIRRLCDEAFAGDFSETDWQHCLGGWHAAVYDDGLLIAHAAVVARRLVADDQVLRAGYVEAVATRPGWQGRGFGSLAMREQAPCLTTNFEFGALSTGEHGFYERLGWERWRGRTFVETPRGLVRTEDEDQGIMVLRFGRNRAVDLAGTLTCAERPGDDW